MPVATHLRTCPLCEAMCGLAIDVEGERVTAVRPDRDDVRSRGYVCPKGIALGAVHHDPDRLREPMLRDGTAWRTASWDEAFARCETLLSGVRARYGPGAITAYVGNPTAHNFSLQRYVGLFIGLAQLPTLYSAGTVDQWPKNVACMLMYGSMWWIPTPDVQRTHYFVVMGGNPHASQGSLLACPDLLGEIAGTLLIHPEDAARCGVRDGARARVTSEAGSVEVPVAVSDEMMPGVVSLPHGWGHDKPGTRLAVARAHAGVNSNLLAPPRLVDPVSNNAVVNGIPVAVAPA